MKSTLIYLNVGEIPTKENVLFSQVYENSAVFYKTGKFSNVIIIFVIPLLSYFKNLFMLRGRQHLLCSEGLTTINLFSPLRVFGLVSFFFEVSYFKGYSKKNFKKNR